MSGPIGSSQWMYSTGAASIFSHTIDQSLRFNDDDDANLKRDITSSGNRKTWTWSAWVKRGNLGGSNGQYLFTDGRSSSLSSFNFNSADKLYVQLYAGAAKYKLTNQVFRDVSAWYHFVWRVDTTQATAEDRSRVYVNGTQITSWSTEQNVNQDTDSTINESGNDHLIGGYSSGTSRNFDGYMAEVNFIDGISYGPENFGETSDGVWIPKQYSGSYGTNGFYLTFADSSAIGDDLSGNGNDFTANNLVASDVVLDSPTNNFATMNPIYHSASQDTLSEGNLKVDGVGFSNAAHGYGAVSTFAIPKDKKIYIEVECTDAIGNTWYAGFASQSGLETGPSNTYVGGANSITVYNRQVYLNGTETDYGSSAGLGGLGVARLAAGDILGCMCDGATGKVWFSRNGTYFKSPSTDNSGTTGDPAGGNHEIGTITNGATEDIFLVVSAGTGASEVFINFGQDSQNVSSAQSDENGIGTFEYAPPTDYVALCSSNLSDPTIGPGQTEQADDNFNTVLYTGNGFPTSGTQSITGCGFQPDWVWIKNRDRSGYNNFLFDSVRGATKVLRSNVANAEGTESTALTSFDSDGFTLGANNEVNYQNDSIVSWNWKAGGTAVSNGNGTITSNVSANQDAGFSIVSFTGNTTNPSTIGHGLSQAPEYIIYKSRDATNGTWYVSSDDIGWTHRLKLDTTASRASSTALWNDTAPTNSVFTISSSLNYNGDAIIAYCFHSVEGYSKFGSFQGNDANFPNGTFVWTGFRPALVVLKASNTNGDWVVTDNKRASSFNGDTARLYWSQNYAETAHNSNRNIELFSNGFKVHGNSASSESNRINENASYIYLAFAEAPLKFANAR